MALPRENSPFQGKVMLDGVARRAVADIGHFFSKERLQNDERARLARELHDGVLQSLTGAALQLKALSRMIGRDPDAVRQRLHDIEQMIQDEQRELRLWIDSARPDAPAAMTSAGELAGRSTSSVGGRNGNGACGEPAWPKARRCPTLADDVIASSRKRSQTSAGTRAPQCARGTAARLDRVQIDVSDDGVGFPFHGATWRRSPGGGWVRCR
jgi:hypothetical protein